MPAPLRVDGVPHPILNKVECDEVRHQFEPKKCDRWVLVCHAPCKDEKEYRADEQQPEGIHPVHRTSQVGNPIKDLHPPEILIRTPYGESLRIWSGFN